MTTPWDRIKDEYRAYLTAIGYTADEFNELATAERAILFNTFEGYQQQQRQQQPLDNDNLANAVFVLYENTNSTPDPIAIAFAVSDSLLLTAAHNVIMRPGCNEDSTNMSDAEEASAKGKGNDSVVENLRIGRALYKDADGHITVEDGGIPVTVAHYHFFHDWAFLKVAEDGMALTDFIPVATSKDELPKRATLQKMVVYTCPVGIFNAATEKGTLHVLAKEVNVGIISEKHLSFQNGGFKVSCGGPYIFRNKAVAMHIASENNAVSFEMLEDSEVQVTRTRKRKMSPLEKTKEVAESSASSHASLGSGVILQARPGLMKVYKGEI